MCANHISKFLDTALEVPQLHCKKRSIKTRKIVPVQESSTGALQQRITANQIKRNYKIKRSISQLRSLYDRIIPNKNRIISEFF